MCGLITQAPFFGPDIDDWLYIRPQGWCELRAASQSGDALCKRGLGIVTGLPVVEATLADFGTAHIRSRLGSQLREMVTEMVF
jgi:hypothetical protein